MMIIAELHDIRRFETARDLMSYLGITPSEHSSSDRRRLGAITRAGNGHARRLLVEAAWHYRHRPAVSFRLRKRREGQPPQIIALAGSDRRPERSSCHLGARRCERGTTDSSRHGSEDTRQGYATGEPRSPDPRS
jgi:hypothetical protein